MRLGFGSRIRFWPGWGRNLRENEIHEYCSCEGMRREGEMISSGFRFEMKSLDPRN